MAAFKPLPVPQRPVRAAASLQGRAARDFPAGVVDERFKETRGVWVVNQEGRLYALIAICTHLGRPPNWLAEQNKFKCPCHGSGYYKNGVNFEGRRAAARARRHLGRSAGRPTGDRQGPQVPVRGRAAGTSPAPTSRSGSETNGAMATSSRNRSGFVKSQIWKSIFRVGIPTDNRARDAGIGSSTHSGMVKKTASG